MADCTVETTDGVMLVRFNRPEKMNSMGGSMLQEFMDALDTAREDDTVRALVVTGEGRAWCAGADLTGGGPATAPGIGLSSPATAEHRRFLRHEPGGGPARVVKALYRVGKPTIAAVNGAAVGGGFGLCSAFDIRIASEGARFGTVFVTRGLAPDFGLSWFLPRLVGPERAAELFYTGRIFGAAEALELRVVSRVVPAESLIDEAVAFATTVAKQAPVAMAYTRRALQHSATASLDDQLEYEWTNQVQALRGPEFKEGIAAFLEKREPDYSRVES